MPKGWEVNPKRDKTGLTPKEKEFAEKAMTMPQGQAAREVFPEIAYPDSKASKLMKKEQVSSYMSSLLDEKGATRNKCAENIFKKIEGRNDKASLEATRMALEIHGELKKDKTILPVPVTKEQYQELCQEFWKSKPSE